MVWLLVSSALAWTLPGGEVEFEEDSLVVQQGTTGIESGWTLTAIDGEEVQTRLDAVRAAVASDRPRVRLLFSDGSDRQKRAVVRRQPVVRVERLDAAALPAELAFPVKRWVRSDTHPPRLVDAQGRGWQLDPLTGWRSTEIQDDVEDQAVPDFYWGLGGAPWVLAQGDDVELGDSAWARQTFAQAARVQRFSGTAGEFLLVPQAGDIALYQVRFPEDVPGVPQCEERVPETCLAAARGVRESHADVEGANDYALGLFDLACSAGVSRACVESIGVTYTDLEPQVDRCLRNNAQTCESLGSQRLATEDTPSDATVGTLRYACDLEASGSIGARLRSMDDVGQGCMQLSAAYDGRKMRDLALLALDEACVLGRAEACDQAAERRHRAFAARTVRECEDNRTPVAESCVALGVLLESEPIDSTELDAFDAFLRACELGAEEGCVELGDYVDRWGITHPRVQAATNSLLASCDKGEVRACVGAGHQLVRHEPRTEAYGDALRLFAGACTSEEASGCIAGAQQRRIGMARKVEAPSQAEMWQAACEAQSIEGCAGLGEELAEKRTGWRQAYDAWTESCEAGYAASCTDIGQLVERAYKKEDWAAQENALDYLEEGCDGGDPEGCHEVALASGWKKGEPNEPTYLLLEQSCEGEFGEGCASLAQVHLDRKTNFDDEIAAGHLDTACSNGEYESCRVLGNMYLRGKGVERDRRRAVELLDQFRREARRRHLRIGPRLGLPTLIGGEVEAVLPIPIGPAIALQVEYTQIPLAGDVLLSLRDRPSADASWRTLGYSARLYPNNKARGLYGALGVQTMEAISDSLSEAEADEVNRTGVNGRVGIRTENKGLYAGFEFGFGVFGSIFPQDFDDEPNTTAPFPLLLPVVGLTAGVAVL